MKVASGMVLVKKAICTAVFAWVKAHFCFCGAFVTAMAIGASRREKVAAVIVCVKLCMYFYLELHQGF